MNTSRLNEIFGQKSIREMLWIDILKVRRGMKVEELRAIKDDNEKQVLPR